MRADFKNVSHMLLGLGLKHFSKNTKKNQYIFSMLLYKSTFLGLIRFRQIGGRKIANTEFILISVLAGRKKFTVFVGFRTIEHSYKRLSDIPIAYREK